MTSRILSGLYRVNHAEAEAQLAHLLNLGLLERQHGVHQVRLHIRGGLYEVFRKRGWA